MKVGVGEGGTRCLNTAYITLQGRNKKHSRPTKSTLGNRSGGLFWEKRRREPLLVVKVGVGGGTRCLNTAYVTLVAHAGIEEDYLLHPCHCSTISTSGNWSDGLFRRRKEGGTHAGGESRRGHAA